MRQFTAPSSPKTVHSLALMRPQLVRYFRVDDDIYDRCIAARQELVQPLLDRTLSAGADALFVVLLLMGGCRSRHNECAFRRRIEERASAAASCSRRICRAIE